MSDIKKLWMATVEHRQVPGTRVKVLYQAAEPTAPEVRKHFESLLDADEVPARALKVTGIFDFSHELTQAGNLEQLQAAIADLTSIATR